MGRKVEREPDLRERQVDGLGNGSAMKILKRKGQSRPSAEQRVQQTFDDAEIGRAVRLGRGNLLIQRGTFATQAEWKKRREEHAGRLDGIDRWLAEQARRKN